MAFTAESLDAYSDLVVKVGLNLRAGQRLLIIGPLANGGASLEAAPLIRRIAASAYRAGARSSKSCGATRNCCSCGSSTRRATRSGSFRSGCRSALLEHVEARPRGAVGLRERSRTT